MIQTIIAFMIISLWLSGDVMAFTLRLGSASSSTSAAPPVTENDLPTPQFFQIAIGRNVTAFGVAQPAQERIPQPAIRYQEIKASQPSAKREVRQISNHRLTTSLSGAELLLLRKTQTVADLQND